MLNDKLKIIGKYNIHPDDVKFIVPEKPIIDTANEASRRALLMANMEIDDTSLISIDEIKNSKRVMYWKMQENKADVDIAGIAWMDNGISKFFEGRILSP
jgi:hypothetical protein